MLPPESYRSAQPQASESQLEQVAELLASAERPAVIAGSGVDRAGANAALLQLVEMLGCPVIATMAGRAVVPGDHAHCLYGFSAGGDLVKREADVVLVVGSRLGNLDLPYDKYWGDPASQKIVQIDVDPRHVGVTRPLTLGILAEAKSALEGLVRVLEKRGLRRKEAHDLARYRQAELAWQDELFKAVDEWSGPGLHPAQVMRSIGEVFGREAIYVTDGGNTSLWAHRFLPPTQPRSYLNILELGMLGTGIPSALGAKLGSPEREVVCVTGDGAAGFNFMEMQSAAREGLDMTTVVFAEGSWTMEEPNERLRYGRTFGTAQGTIRWDVVGQGLGCAGFYAERLEEVKPALEGAKAEKGAAVVCIRSDRDANLAMPGELLMRFLEVYEGPIG